MKNLTLTLNILALAVGCNIVGPTKSAGPNLGASSELTDISVAMPDKKIFGGVDVDAFRVIVKDTSCRNMIIQDTVSDYASTTLNTVVARACNYEMSLYIGKKAVVATGAPASLAAVSFATLAPKILATAQLQGPSPIAVVLEVAPSTMQPPSANVPNAFSQPAPQDGTLHATYSKITLGKKSGDVNMAQAFKGPVMMVDFSQEFCGPCKSFAKQIADDKDVQAKLQAGKCSIVTIIPEKEENDWERAIGAEASKHTYYAKTIDGNAGSQDGLSKILNTKFSSIPAARLYLRGDDKPQKIGKADPNSAGADSVFREFKRLCAP